MKTHLFTLFSTVLLQAAFLPSYAQSHSPLKSDTYTIQKPSLKHPLYHIKEVEIKGTQYASDIKLVIYLRVGDVVSSEALEADKERIKKLGYFSQVSFQLQKLAQGNKLVIQTQENPKLKQVSILSAPQIYTKQKIRAYFESQLKQTLNIVDLRQTFERILQDYHRAGYTLAHIEVTDEVQAFKKGHLKLILHEGVIKDVQFSGHELTQNHVLLRELNLKPGSVFQTQALEKDLQRLKRLDYFESIEPQTKISPSSSHEYLLHYKLKEKPNRDAGFNFSLGNRNGLVGGVYYKDLNFLGEGRQVNLDLKTSLNFLNPFSGENLQNPQTLFGRVDFFDPWLLEDRTSFGSSLFSERNPLTLIQGESALLQTRTGVKLRMGRPLFGDYKNPWRGSVSFTAEQIGIQDLNLKPRPDLTLSKRLNGSDHQFSVGGTLSVDTRNSILNPTQGVFGSISARPFWGDGNYLRFTGALSGYWPIMEWLTLATNIQGGAFIGENPAYEQFFSTGISAIRGWQESGALFGKQYVLGSAEVRFPIYNPVSGVIFADLGEFFSERSLAMSPGLPFKYGVGAGLRVATPLGLIRFDYGIKDFGKLRTDTLFEAGQIHFSIGQKF